MLQKMQLGNFDTQGNLNMPLIKLLEKENKQKPPNPTLPSALSVTWYLHTGSPTEGFALSPLAE